jgi:hypothetical protein
VRERTKTSAAVTRRSAAVSSNEPWYSPRRAFGSLVPPTIANRRSSAHLWEGTIPGSRISGAATIPRCFD